MDGQAKQKVVDAIIKLYDNRLNLIRPLTEQNNTGGKIRAANGQLGEDISKMAWQMIGNTYAKSHGIKFRTIKGDKKKVICTNSKGNRLEVQVDRHQFINGKLVHCEECKSYLDRCYMERAMVDFIRIRQYHPKVSTSILALENCVAEESFDFLMDEGTIDQVSYLLDGRRSSAAPYWHPKSIKTMPKQRVEAYVDEIVKVFEREIS